MVEGINFQAKCLLLSLSLSLSLILGNVKSRHSDTGLSHITCIYNAFRPHSHSVIEGITQCFTCPTLPTLLPFYSQERVEQYSLPDVGKAVRIMLEYGVMETDPADVFGVIRKSCILYKTKDGAKCFSSPLKPARPSSPVKEKVAKAQPPKPAKGKVDLEVILGHAFAVPLQKQPCVTTLCYKERS